MIGIKIEGKDEVLLIEYEKELKCRWVKMGFTIEPKSATFAEKEAYFLIANEINRARMFHMFVELLDAPLGRYMARGTFQELKKIFPKGTFRNVKSDEDWHLSCS